MKLTARGWTVVLVAGLAIGIGLAFGQQSLNAVAAPLLGAVGYGVVTLWRSDPPTVTAGEVQPGYPGERRQVSLAIAGGGVLKIRHRWSAGLDGEPIETIVTPPATLEREVVLGSRGVHDLDEFATWRRDPLGLVVTATAIDVGARAIVYPQVYRAAGGGALSPLLADDHRVERQAFDTLREYRPGDPLRRIHWKSSAKHEDFLVTEFASDRRVETLTIAGDAEPGMADELATAVGTLALAALRAGLDVGLTVPDAAVPTGSGDAHRANLLGVLARVGSGTVPPPAHEEADVSVKAGRKSTTIAAGGRTVTLDALAVGPDTRPIQEVAGT